MKKIIAMLLAVMMVVGMFAACGNDAPETTAPVETQPVETQPVETEFFIIKTSIDPHHIQDFRRRGRRPRRPVGKI